MAVNITVDQQQAAFQQASVVDPVTTFLGDHVASVQLATSAPTSIGVHQPHSLHTHKLKLTRDVGAAAGCTRDMHPPKCKK